MLVLSRKLMEQIQIGENITVTVVHVKGKIVKLGIDAPRDIRILRTELITAGEQTSAENESDAVVEPTEDEPTDEGDAPCHGRLARPCRQNVPQAPRPGLTGGARGPVGVVYG